MGKKNQHVVPTNDGWGVRGEGNSKITKKTKTKEEAINFAKEIAKNQESELVIHNQNGKISEKESYGNDSCPPKDQN
jgi:hypothetical protein